MTKNSRDQLSFDLPSSEKLGKTCGATTHHNVVGFVDASTRSFRSQAVERVSRAGIFSAYGTKHKG